MRIVVCVKQIRHIYARTGVDPARNYLAPEDALLRVNPYDEAAMELASRVKGLLGKVEIIGVTLGPIIAEAELMRCLALGADHLFQIDRSDARDPWSKSGFLARAIRQMRPNLILCGKESLDTQSGQVGAFLAHRLRLPFVSAITDVQVDKDQGSASVQRSAGRGIREVIECGMPAVFSVDLRSREPHFPTYEDKHSARSIPVQRLAFGEDVAPPKIVSEGVIPPRPRPKQAPAPDSSLPAFDRIQQLLSGTRVEKSGLRLEGDVKSQVDGVISFLKEHCFLGSKGAARNG